MKEFDEKFWKETLAVFSQKLGLPIRVVDKSGDVRHTSGEGPFILDLVCNSSQGRAFAVERFRDLARAKPGCYSFCLGLTFVSAPINDHVLLVGPMLTDSPDLDEVRQVSQRLHIDFDELQDEVAKLKQEEIAYLLPAIEGLAEHLAQRGIIERKRSEKIERLEFLQRLSDAFESSLNMNQIMGSALEYIVKTFKLENCSVTLFDEDKRFAFKQMPDSLKKAENLLRTHMESVKNFIAVSDVSKSFMFEKIPDIDNEKTALMAYPLLAQDNLSGMILLYRDNFPADDLEMIPILVRRLAQSLATSTSLRKMRDFAVTDRLTGLYNRAYFNEFFKKEVERGRRSGKPLSLAIFDIDDFKKFNDNFGHPVGDQILRDIGTIIKGNVRSFDTACRYGGEEFCVIMPDVDPNEALAIAERLRSVVAANRFGPFEDQLKPVTISIGLITCMNSSLSSSEMLQKADTILYQAKAQGKNRVLSGIVIDKSMGEVDVQQANSLYSTQSN